MFYDEKSNCIFWKLRNDSLSHQISHVAAAATSICPALSSAANVEGKISDGSPHRRRHQSVKFDRIPFSPFSPILSFEGKNLFAEC
jgi:hypothetical protein